MPFSLLACSVLPGAPALGCEIAPHPDLGIATNIPVPPLPVPTPASMAAHDLAILLDATPINEALDWLYSEEQLFTYTVTPSLVPASLPLKLNTDSFSGIAPAMTKQYPGEDLQILVNASARPYITFGDGILNVTAPIELVWSVCNKTIRDCNAVFDGPGLTEVFRIGLPARVGLTVKSAPGANGTTLVTGNVPYIEAEMVLVSSNVGAVTVSDLQGLVNLGISSAAIPKINAILNKGAAIPTTLGPVTVKDLDVQVRGYTI
jgi:hypothetical protein